MECDPGARVVKKDKLDVDYLPEGFQVAYEILYLIFDHTEIALEVARASGNFGKLRRADP